MTQVGESSINLYYIWEAYLLGENRAVKPVDLGGFLVQSGWKGWILWTQWTTVS